MKIERPAGRKSSLSERERRMRATPRLREQLAREGRRHNWIANRLGMSGAQFSRVVSGTRLMRESDARVLAALVNGDLGVLFELPESRERLPNGRFTTQEARA
jgi:hypothetical protein